MDKRSFPRYDTIHLKAYLVFFSHNNPQQDSEAKYWVKDISLGGLQIFSEKDITTFKENREAKLKARFFLGEKFVRDIFIEQVWSKESKVDKAKYSNYPHQLLERMNKINKQYGLKLYFEEEKDFKNWRTLIQAIHNSKLK